MKPYLREKYLEQYYYYRNYSTGPASLRDLKINIDQALKFILSVNPKTCNKYVISVNIRARCNVNIYIDLSYI